MASAVENQYEILDLLENAHIPAGPTYQGLKRMRALLALPHNEVEAIYHLTESHRPGLRFRASVQYEKALNAEDENATPKTIKKENIDFLCTDRELKDKINTMLRNVGEMPKQWTIVQLTPQYNQEESLECDPDKVYTNPIHISVFDCGRKSVDPFCVTVDAPVDTIAKQTIEICKEMRNIVEQNKLLIRNLLVSREGFFKNFKDKQAYSDARDLINCRLKNVVKEMQWKWLKEFRCLLVGKLEDDAVEENIAAAVDEFFASGMLPAPSKRTKAIFKCLIKGSKYLKLHEQKRVVQYLFENVSRDVQLKTIQFTQNLCERLKLHETRRHPLILVVDEKLDILPWEMMDILENHPVTRMPSLHFTYALFKEYEDSIIDGMKIINNPENGGYVLNPDSDLRQMEVRMKNFFAYYYPEWKALIGIKPTSEQFEEMLITCDIFSYHGHGNGAQFLSGDKIQKTRVRAVALLFGCSSVSLTSLGPQVEMFGQHDTYLIACSPCVVGMLWTVTDLDTDTLTTGFLSQWVKTTAPNHWKCINKQQWLVNANIVKNASPKGVKQPSNEPELLRALCKARKEARHYVTSAACVSRGLPVKIRY